MIFLDASYIISSYFKEANRYERTIKIEKSIASEEKIISNLVIAETMTVANIKLKENIKLIEKLYYQLNEQYEVVEDSYFYKKSLKNMIDIKKRISFFDSVYITIMKELDINKIASFDSDFDNIKGIKRIY